MEIERSSDGGVRKRTSTACEACRSSKLRCLPSAQPGVCKKCLESKKECVSRTGPRVRRSKKAILAQAQSQSPAATPAPVSSTFTINFAMPAEPELDETFDILRETHNSLIDNLFPEDTDSLPRCPSTLGSMPTPPASTANSQPMDELHAKPQFNRASAESLLESFRSMLIHFPCIVLQPHETVGHLAATRPFVLLAILSAASGSRTLRGHVLYDEEFRKVLGLKFVAGGERSIELLQGILIYCAWFPFHLRPKNKQVFHYIRMAADLLHDLELDQETGPCKFTGFPDDTQLDCLRAYLSFQYLVTMSAVFTPSPYKSLLTCTFTPWTMTCCDLLDSFSEDKNDRALTTLLRLSSTTGSAWEAVYERKGQSDQQGFLALLGLETQLRSLRDMMPPDIASLPSVKMAVMSTEIYLNGGVSLLRLTRLSRGAPSPLPPDQAKLYPCCQLTKEFLEYLLSLANTGFTSFTCIDWSKFVSAIIISIRLSFPLMDCPGWDDSWARNHLQFEAFLDKLCEEPDATDAKKQMDVLSATRVVVSVVREKYERNMAKIHAAEAFEASMANMGGCPMLDGSLSHMIPTWDPEITLNPMAMGSPGKGAGSQQIFHDLWATMTMGWADEGDLKGEPL